jgi:hypothetical protein
MGTFNTGFDIELAATLHCPTLAEARPLAKARGTTKDQFVEALVEIDSKV